MTITPWKGVVCDGGCGGWEYNGVAAERGGCEDDGDGVGGSNRRRGSVRRGLGVRATWVVAGGRV